MDDKKKRSKFHEAIARLLEQKLAVFSDERDLDSTTCLKIYNKIFEIMVYVFTNAGVNITNESMNWLAQQYYDGVLINGRYELDPNIFDKRAKLENIETKELALLATMLLHTDFALPIIAEIKHRS